MKKNFKILYFLTTLCLVLLLAYCTFFRNGEQGEKGETGEAGEKGETGVGIQSIDIDGIGRLVITLTDGTELDPIEMPKHVHTFGEWTNFSDDTETACEKKLSFATCSVCGEIGWQQGRHTYNTYSITPPTCTENGYHSYTCVVCGETDTVPAEEPLGHEWDKCYSYDDASHWIACLDCDARDSLSKHTLDENGFCKACTVGSDSEEFAYKLSEDSTYAALVGYFGEKTEIVVPTSYKKFSVKEISGGAFARNKSITSVVIPQGITYIGAAFGECTALANINIPEGVTELGGGVFSECTSLTSITLPRSLVKIGARAFYGCKSLESVTFLDADTWYYEWHHTDGTEISVTDPTANATYLKKTYYMYFWTKK